MLDIVTVGHFAIDQITSPAMHSSKPTLGGPPTYVSLAAQRLNAKVGVISKVGRDFSGEYMKWLRNNHVNLFGLNQVEDAFTTRFALTYENQWKIKLQLRTSAPQILPSDIPNSLQTKVAHIAPIVNELPEDTIAKLRKLVKILSLDPQGFVRSFDSKGNVRLKPWHNTHLLEITDIFKSTQDELKTIAGLSDTKLGMEKIRDIGVKLIIITKGVKGSTLMCDDNFYDIPPCKSRAVLDPTGAGDAFIGAFLAEHLKTRNSVWSACVGSASASFVVEGVGPQRFGRREETYERANRIYEKLSRK